MVAEFHWPSQEFSRTGIPNSRGFVSGGRGQPAAVRAEPEVTDRQVVLEWLQERSAGRGLPQTDQVVLPAGGGHPSVGTERRAEDRLIVVQGRANRFAGRGVPNLGRVAVRSENPFAIRIERNLLAAAVEGNGRRDGCATDRVPDPRGLVLADGSHAS